MAWLDGRLDLGPAAPGRNDWACFDTVDRGPCPAGRYAFDGPEASRYRWHVAFPPLPAAILLPVVALFGVGTWDALIWFLFAGLGPALLFVVLRSVRESGESGRSLREDLWLTVLFAVGTVYYFASVQGTVWFAAHVVATVLVCAYLYFGLGARSPAAAGACLGLAFLSRPSTLFLAPFFVVQALRPRGPEDRPTARALSAFALALGAFVALAMVHNEMRFDDPFEFGHRFLQIRWRSRIETWGLFSSHYLPRNLTVFFLSLPWWLSEAPYVRISRHGLALWFTTPNLLWSLGPTRWSSTITALWAAIIPTALCTLLYQNTGWVQFGYRFSLDYLPLLFLVIALGGRRFGRLFVACALVAVLVNGFGALTFNRHHQFYDTDTTQDVIFQPD